MTTTDAYRGHVPSPMQLLEDRLEALEKKCTDLAFADAKNTQWFNLILRVMAAGPRYHSSSFTQITKMLNRAKTQPELDTVAEWVRTL